MSFRTEDTPEEIAALADRCVLHVKGRFGLELDYTIETLSALDHFVRQVLLDETEGRPIPAGDRRRSPVAHLLAPTLGAYFGEVMRREYPSRWRNTALEPFAWALEFEEFFLRFNPAGSAMEAVMCAPVDDWAGALATSPQLTGPLQERLAAAPPLPEDEFFSFCARLEAIQIAADYLRERASKDGPVGCKTEDYDKVFG
jgi:hypothetical protein